MSASHVFICTDATIFSISPIPVGYGEIFIPSKLLDLMFPQEQKQPMPRKEAWSFMCKVYIPPDVGASKERVSRHVIMHPDKKVIDTGVSEHRSAAVVHLGIRSSGNDKIPTGGIFCQIEIGKELVVFSGAQLEDVFPDAQLSFRAVGSSKVEFAIPAVVSHKVARAPTSLIVKHSWPVLSVIHSGERELRAERSSGKKTPSARTSV